MPVVWGKKTCSIRLNTIQDNKLEFGRLFLLLGLGLGGLLGALLAGTGVALVGTLVAQLAESTTLDGGGEVGLLDLLDGGVGVDNREGSGGDGDGLGDSLELLLGRVALLGLVALLGEENQALGVSLEALNVGGQGLLGDVVAASIDGDTDGGGILAGNASGLDSLVRTLDMWKQPA